MNRKDNFLQFRLPSLAVHDVQVFYAKIGDFRPDLAKYFDLLAEPERARVNNFRLIADKERFVLARGWSKLLLAQHLQLAPKAIEFAYTSHGKPYLANSLGLQFNISHAEDVVLLAFGQLPLGVDIEYMHRDLEVDRIAQEFFHQHEFKALAQLTGLHKQQDFFRLWVAKEAFSKALGLGLSYDLAKIELLLTSAESLQIVSIHDPAENLADWHIQPLTIMPNYLAALAFKGKVQNLLVQNLQNLLT